MTNRRKFLQLAIASMGMPLVPKALAATLGPAFRTGRWADVTDPGIWMAAWKKKFTNTLPWALNPDLGLGTGAGFIYKPDDLVTNTYNIHAGQIEWDVLGITYGDVPALPRPVGKAATDKVMTPVWGYGNDELLPAMAVTHPGRSFVVQSGTPIQVNWSNNLTDGPDGTGAVLPHLLPVDGTVAMEFVDPTAAAPEAIGGVPIAIHLHGSDSHEWYDGGPDQWLTPRRQQVGPGISASNSVADTTTTPGHLAYTYDNKQEAGLLWYHDHAEGMTRTNAYAGLAGAYVIRDANEDYLIGNNIIPSGPYEHVLVLQDKVFAPDGSYAYPGDPARYPVPILTQNPDLSVKVVDPATNTTGANLKLPNEVVPGAAGAGEVLTLDPNNPNVDPITGANGSYFVDRSNPTHFPEMFGDVVCVNGVAWPCLKVEPREYRLRLLNGSDSRFFTLQFGKLPVWHIATELGMNPTPVAITGKGVTIGPGERMDVVVDFGRALKEGFKRVVVTNSAPTPFPGGAAVVRNSGPDVVMAFDISLALNALVPVGANPLPRTKVTTLGANLRLRGWDTIGNIAPVLSRRPAVPRGARRRRILLAEGADQYGRIMPLLGVFRMQTMAQDAAIVDALGNAVEGTLPFADPATELPAVGSTEVWEFWNVSVDAHPIHMHLVRFRVLDRQAFAGGNLVPSTMSNGRSGVTLVDDPKTSPVVFATVDPLTSALLPAAPVQAPAWEQGWKDTVVCYPGQVTRVVVTFDRPGNYVYHCHILSHEERDMMRWYRVA